MASRILKAVPEIDLRVKMDALVHDLSEALKDSSCAASGRVKAGFRRRTRSAGSVAIVGTKATHSDDSISEKLHSRKEMVQSDSDEVSTNSLRRMAPYPLQKRNVHVRQTPNFESDSVNENFSPLRTGARRKRKIKRMDCDSGETIITPSVDVSPCAPLEGSSAPSLTLCLPGPHPSVDFPRSLIVPGPSGIRTLGKKKKVPKDVDGFEAAVGKRKRSNRERRFGLDTNRRSLKSGRLVPPHGERMDVEQSSSSLSSSESDAGVQTNDEGREGDDEQSDWFADARPDEETDLETDDPAFQKFLHGSLDQMTTDAREAYSDRMEWLRNGLVEREIRGGRRRVHDDRPGFSVLTSANEKLSKFLQDCQQLTLTLHPMEQEEQEQLVQLVNMYSLRMRVEVSNQGETCPVLTKTSATPRTVPIDAGILATADCKKRRKLPQQGAVLGPPMDMAWELRSQTKP